MYMTSLSTWAIAFLVGNILFTANVYAISAISSMLIQSMGGSQDRSPAELKRMKKLGLVIGSLKLLGLMLGLYLALVYFRLSGLAFAIGALSSLVMLTIMFSIHYLKRLGQSGGAKSI
ncbi:MAG: hypothetical protein ACOH5I_05840 [Oligoflexus sp.]